MQINFDLKLSFTKRIIIYDGLKVCAVTLIGIKTCVQVLGHMFLGQNLYKFNVASL